MDYLVYADLQLRRDQQAAEIVHQLKSMSNLNFSDFKIAYGGKPQSRFATPSCAVSGPTRQTLSRPLLRRPQVLAVAIWLAVSD